MTRRDLALLLLGFIAGIASAASYPMSTANVELETAWHDFAEVPRDSDEFDRQWHQLGTAVWQETIKHRHATLFVACQLKTAESVDH